MIDRRGAPRLARATAARKGGRFALRLSGSRSRAGPRLTGVGSRQPDLRKIKASVAGQPHPQIVQFAVHPNGGIPP